MRSASRPQLRKRPVSILDWLFMWMFAWKRNWTVHQCQHFSDRRTSWCSQFCDCSWWTPRRTYRTARRVCAKLKLTTPLPTNLRGPPGLAGTGATGFGAVSSGLSSQHRSSRGARGLSCCEKCHQAEEHHKFGYLLADTSHPRGCPLQHALGRGRSP